MVKLVQRVSIYSHPVSSIISISHVNMVDFPMINESLLIYYHLKSTLRSDFLSFYLGSHLGYHITFSSQVSLGSSRP